MLSANWSISVQHVINQSYQCTAPFHWSQFILESVKWVFCEWLVHVRWLCCLSTASEYKHPKSFSWDKYMEETGTQAAPARAFKPVTHTQTKQTKKTHTVPYSYLGSHSHIAMPTWPLFFRITLYSLINVTIINDLVAVVKLAGYCQYPLDGWFTSL